MQNIRLIFICRALSPKLFERVSIRRNVLQPGDLIAVRTPGTIYRLFRQAAGHTVDHLVRQVI